MSHEALLRQVYPLSQLNILIFSNALPFNKRKRVDSGGMVDEEQGIGFVPPARRKRRDVPKGGPRCRIMLISFVLIRGNCFTALDLVGPTAIP